MVARWSASSGNVDIGRDMVSFGEIPGMQLYIALRRLTDDTHLAVAVYGTAPSQRYRVDHA